MTTFALNCAAWGGFGAGTLQFKRYETEQISWTRKLVREMWPTRRAFRRNRYRIGLTDFFITYHFESSNRVNVKYTNLE
jgi:hypothetical protein